jgi:hypothetical protein
LPLAPAPAPEMTGAAGIVLSPEEIFQVRHLEDRRAMETREELQRIRTMQRVKVSP